MTKKQDKEIAFLLQQVEATVLSLKPGDVLGLCFPAGISADDMRRTAHAFKKLDILPPGVKSFVYCKPLELTVIRKEDAPATCLDCEHPLSAGDIQMGHKRCRLCYEANCLAP